jgi:aminopeptidase
MSLSFEQILKNYADLMIHTGLNVRAGQKVLIRAPIQGAPLVRLAAASAYQAGARLVDVLYGDELITLTRFQHAPRDSFEEFPVWQTKVIEEYAANGDAILSIYAQDPNLLKEQDPELISTFYRTASRHSQAYSEHIQRNNTNWCVVSVPIPSWASKVFPDLTEEEQVDRLWDAIFDVCRLKLDNPLAAWEEHIQQLEKRKEFMNEKDYVALHYKGPGTDLKLGLPEGHTWTSGRSPAKNGIDFIANLPTEEIFTLPHRERADGYISATRPLNHGGTLIEGFILTFEDGKVIKAVADEGEALLQKLVETDENAGRLGEIALLPHSSPISQSGILFYNTLFDENASSHLALGSAYQFNLRGGTELTKEEFVSRGGNHSMIHVDFMVGSENLDINALTQDGAVEPLMRGGEWAVKL